MNVLGAEGNRRWDGDRANVDAWAHVVKIPQTGLDGFGDAIGICLVTKSEITEIIYKRRTVTR